MKAIILDTNAVISLFDGDPDVEKKIADAERVLIPAIVLGELRVGINGTRRGLKTLKALDEFIDQPFVTVLPVTDETAACYAMIVKHLREQGTPIPANDIWIAAAAIETCAPLLTRDDHFSKIPMIRLA